MKTQLAFITSAIAVNTSQFIERVRAIIARDSSPKSMEEARTAIRKLSDDLSAMVAKRDEEANTLENTKARIEKRIESIDDEIVEAENAVTVLQQLSREVS